MTKTTPEMIEKWFDKGSDDKNDYMFVVCDTFDWEDYPVYSSREDFWNVFNKYDRKDMQKIVEVYDLNQNKTEQIREYRVWRVPK